MSGATRLQQRHASGVARLVAAVTGLWLVVCGLATLHHDSVVAHMRDASGHLIHAAALGGHHDANRTQADIHGQRDPEADTGVCALDVGFQPTALSAKPPILSSELRTAAVAVSVAPPGLPCVARAIYRDAPKTSPPIG